MNDIKNLYGSISTEDFIDGLLSALAVDSLGDIWDKNADCGHCRFVKQCKIIGEHFDKQNKNITCGQIVDLLLGEIALEDIK